MRPEQAVRRYLASNPGQRTNGDTNLHYMEHRGVVLIVYDALRSQDAVERRPPTERRRFADLDMIEWRLSEGVATSKRSLPENTIRAAVRTVLADGEWHLVSDLAEGVQDAIDPERARSAAAKWSDGRRRDGYEPNSPTMVGDPIVDGRRAIVRDVASVLGVERQWAFRLRREQNK